MYSAIASEPTDRLSRLFGDDAEGNRIAKVVGDVQFDIDENPYPTSVGSSAVTYHYDHRNRLIEVISLELEQSGMTETRSIYTYDVDDRRDYRFNLDETQTATEERIVYDGSLPLVVWDDVNQFYLYGASGEVLAQEDAATGASWPLADHQQSVRIVLDATGSDVAEENDYDAFGNSTNEDFEFRVTHHGGEFERLTKLIHMGPRVLDTLTNQFLQQDAAQETTHPSVYARNNPVNRHDRSGYFSAAHGSAFGGTWGGMYLSPQYNTPVASADSWRDELLDFDVPFTAPTGVMHDVGSLFQQGLDIYRPSNLSTTPVQYFTSLGAPGANEVDENGFNPYLRARNQALDHNAYWRSAYEGTTSWSEASVSSIFD